MNVTIQPKPLRGVLKAISSKSDVHRLLICAALCDGPVQIQIDGLSQDIEATARCLNALGASVLLEEGRIRVSPIMHVPSNAVLDCGESGSTLRFLLPVACALGADAAFTGSGRLPQRPLSPLYEQLEAHGVCLSPQGQMPLTIRGTLGTQTPFVLAGDVSSQYISGLLMALPLCGGEIVLTTPLESKPYVQMTLDTLRRFGVQAEQTASGWRVRRGALCAPQGPIAAQGDWSNAAFWLCAGAIAGPVTVRGLDRDSPQGDRAIVAFLQRMGAQVRWDGDSVTVWPGTLHAAQIDVRDTPDLAPVLAAVAALAQGETVITGAARLRIKESDRLRTVQQTLQALGAQICATHDGLRIVGQRRLSGGQADACGDHRIAMMAAIAAAGCERPVTITGAQAVNKSYPAFFEDYQRLCAQ
jgi:3-phosphoshikimate 1-carboxyvinyltransferase